ncbi:Endonuclease III [bioreactor metagenome]|uniref:Endonuclease III n=1 Tax=bioreactor metagenome TaxID=1076179 RepID=A0A645H0A5_9ZZZZ
MKISGKRKKAILAVLEETYKDESTALVYSSPFELLIAVILSAQCTDERVNKITAELFPEFKTPAQILALGQARLENYIKGCGLYRNKAKNIIATCEILCRDHNGEVPASFEELTRLPGVGRKTANVLLSQLFNIPAIAVDTHVFRVSNRLGLAEGKIPDQVEFGLMKVIPKEKWSAAHHWLIWHGRKVCKARNPECENCPTSNMCISSKMKKQLHKSIE